MEHLNSAMAKERKRSAFVEWSLWDGCVLSVLYPKTDSKTLNPFSRGIALIRSCLILEPPWASAWRVRVVRAAENPQDQAFFAVRSPTIPEGRVFEDLLGVMLAVKP